MLLLLPLLTPPYTPKGTLLHSPVPLLHQVDGEGRVTLLTTRDPNPPTTLLEEVLKGATQFTAAEVKEGVVVEGGRAEGAPPPPPLPRKAPQSGAVFTPGGERRRSVVSPVGDKESMGCGVKGEASAGAMTEENRAAREEEHCGEVTSVALLHVEHVREVGVVEGALNTPPAPTPPTPLKLPGAPATSTSTPDSTLHTTGRDTAVITPARVALEG